MGFEVVSPLMHVTVIGRGRHLRELRRVLRAYGFGPWQRRRAFAHLWLREGRIALAEIHWLKSVSGACVELKIKRFLEDTA